MGIDPMDAAKLRAEWNDSIPANAELLNRELTDRLNRREAFRIVIGVACPTCRQERGSQCRTWDHQPIRSYHPERAVAYYADLKPARA